MNVKAQRGDCISLNNDNIRDEKYYRNFDLHSNDIYDFELCNIK
jgi:hypothetical protein